MPAYNEEKNLPSVLKKLQDAGWSVYVIDDGSRDRTHEILRDWNIAHHKAQANSGKGAALRHGFDWFLKQGHEICVVMDADGQHQVEEIDYFVEAIETGGADVVLGNRMTNPAGMPLVRVWTNRFMSALISILAGTRIHDTQCGFRAYHRRAVEKIRFESNRFEAESEILFSAASQRLKIHSVAVSSVYRDETSSIHPVRDTVRFFRFLIKYFLR